MLFFLSFSLKQQKNQYIFIEIQEQNLLCDKIYNIKDENNENWESQGWNMKYCMKLVLVVISEFGPFIYVFAAMGVRECSKERMK